MGSKQAVPKTRGHAKIFLVCVVMMYGVPPFKLSHEAITAAAGTVHGIMDTDIEKISSQQSGGES